MKKLLLMTIAFGLLLFSCSDDKGTDPPDTKEYEIPESYNFDNVDFSGQLTRMEMVGEMRKLITDAIKNETAISAGVLQQMFENQGTPFVKDSLNKSSKNLYTKTDLTRQSFFEGYFRDMNNVSTTKIAGNNKKGILVTKDGTQTFLVDSVGKEYLTMIEDGLMGACFFYQVAHVYTSDEKIGDQVDNTEVIEGQGTAMQHHWDEAFGYFGAPTDFPITKNNLSFLAKYCNDRDPLLNTNELLMKEGFIKGRAAINNDDKEGKLEAVAAVRKNWELVLVSTAIHHLNLAMENFDDVALKHHNMTKAWILLWSVQFNPESNGFSYEDALAKIGTNFWNTSEISLNDAKEILSNAYNLGDIKNAL